jgi:Spy/CpxP family protein refolding chaperone
MMRTLCVVSTLLVVVLVCPGRSLGDKNRQGGQIREAVVEKIHDLNLTKEQEAKIADIRKECKPKVQEAAKELDTLVKDEVERIRAVLTDDQKQKLDAFNEERKEHRTEGLAQRLAQLKELDLTHNERTKIQDIRNESRPRIAKAMEGLKGTLTEEQRKTREEGLEAGKKHTEVLESLNLTTEQKEKIAAVGKDLAPVVCEEMEKIRDVLSEEQQAQLPELKEERMEQVRDRMAHRVANFNDLNLTAEQKTKIEEIRKEFRPKIHEAGNKVRAAVREEIAMILAAIKS